MEKSTSGPVCMCVRVCVALDVHVRECGAIHLCVPFVTKKMCVCVCVSVYACISVFLNSCFVCYEAYTEVCVYVCIYADIHAYVRAGLGGCGCNVGYRYVCV